jgi:hypothetical protein
MTMCYVRRDGSGNIVGVFAWPQDDAVEQLADDNADVVAFLNPPAIVPQTVSRMQAMVALSRAGLLTPVQTWVAGQDAEIQLIWNNAPDFSRDSTLLANAAAALGLTAAQVDALFVSAAAISP